MFKNLKTNYAHTLWFNVLDIQPKYPSRDTVPFKDIYEYSAMPNTDGLVMEQEAVYSSNSFSQFPLRVDTIQNKHKECITRFFHLFLSQDVYANASTIDLRTEKKRQSQKVLFLWHCPSFNFHIKPINIHSIYSVKQLL